MSIKSKTVSRVGPFPHRTLEKIFMKVLDKKKNSDDVDNHNTILLTNQLLTLQNTESIQVKVQPMKQIFNE